MTKLYTVTATLEFEMAVMADSKDAARRLAEQHYKDEAENFTGRDVEFQIVEGNEFTDSDIFHTCPWGGDGVENVAEVANRLGLKSRAELYFERKGEDK